MPQTRRLTKKLFLSAQTCQAQAWYVAHDDAGGGEPTPADSFRMNEGIEIGKRARSLFPHGVLVGSSNMDEAVAETQHLLQDKNVTALFEAAFAVDGMVTRADVLVRHGQGWKLIEVKSSMLSSEKPADDRLIADLSYTAMVVTRSGLKLTGASLLLISRAYRLGDPNASLFTEEDRADEVLPALPGLAETAVRHLTVLDGRSPPAPRLIRECRDCPYFEGVCLGKGAEHHILTLPRLHENRLSELFESGISEVASVPDDFELTASQLVVHRAVIERKPVWNRGELTTLLSEVEWPAGYLDFETVMTSLPLYPGVAPYDQLVTQYSLHVCDAPGQERHHREYLADASRESRRELAEKLLDDLQHARSIIVYSGFEKRVLSGLSTLFPDLAVGLSSCIERLFDLEQAVKPGVYYHPEFRGRSSIKKTFPVLVPGSSYEDLAIRDGQTAVAVFAMMARGDITGLDAQRARQNLLEYCKRDTLAMVALHGALISLAH